MTHPSGPPCDDAEPDVDLRASLRPAHELPERLPRRRQVEVEGVEESLRPMVDQAVADLVARLGIAPTQVRVEAAGAVTWSDGSCGCPERGRAYPQVPVDGFYVRLAAQGRLFHFHGGGRRGLFLCDR
jgi:hypothetical protein